MRLPEPSTLEGLDLELNEAAPAVHLVRDAVRPEHAAEWIAERKDALNAAVERHGAVLVRGLGLSTPSEVGLAAAQLRAGAAPEREAFAKRTPYGGNVFSSLEWPPDQPMCMHHELSYALEVPQLLVIGCLTAPKRGGITAVADAAAVLAALPADLVDRFDGQGWQLTRSYHELIGVPWQEAFGTTDRAVAEEYCQANGIAIEWQPDGGLRTRQRRAAVVDHPVTGQRCWFNQIAFLNKWTMEPAVREYLEFEFGAEGLPFNTYHGDGEPLDAETVELINDTYEAATLREPWRAGDLLLVDNIRMAHSREPYEGQRDIALVLADPVRLTDGAPPFTSLIGS